MKDDLTRLREEYKDRSYRFSQSDIYSLFNSAKLFRYQQRQRMLLKVLRKYGFFPLGESKILEIGSGGGGVLLEFLSYDAKPSNLFGVELLYDRNLKAKERLPNHVALVNADAQNLPLPADTFDIIVQATVFSSILDSNIKANMAREMLRVLRYPNKLAHRSPGMIIWHDFWLNPTNRQTQGIKPAEIRKLFPGCNYKFYRITLAPPIACRLVRVSWLLCALLEKLIVFNTHYLVAIQPVWNSDR